MGKTEAIVFSSKRKKHLISNFEINCQNHKIVASPEVKYLGLKLDQTLSGETTVNSIVKKCSSRLNFMYRHQAVLTKNTRKLLSSAIILCHFDYGITSWYMGLTKKLKQNLQVAQNKTVRFISNMGPRTHIGQQELNALGLLCVEDRAKQLSLNHMYNIFNNCAPLYLCNLFTRIGHVYNTRHSENNFVLPSAKGISSSNFSFQGVKIWNDLPNYIKLSQNKDVFKKRVKNHLSQNSNM